MAARQNPMVRQDDLNRLILEQIADKWSIMIVAALCPGALRFNALRRELEGITQKTLTHTLRRLERLGLVERRVIPVSPVAVEYSVTPLGESLKEPFQALFQWTIRHGPDLEAAKRRFDRERSEGDQLDGGGLQSVA